MADLAKTNTPDVLLPSLTIWVKRDTSGRQAGAWMLDRITAVTDSFTQTMAFHKPTGPNDALIPDLGNVLRAYLPRGQAPVVLTAADFELDSHGVTLNGLSVTGQEARNGIQRVIISFKNFIGSINALFLPGRAPTLLQDTENDLAARTLNDIVMPVLNLAVADPMAVGKHSKALSERLELFWGRLAQNKAEIEFYCTLILRFMARHSSMSDKPQISHQTNPIERDPPAKG